MSCEDIRKLISDDIDGAASPEETERVRQHLESCPECRALREQWLRIDGAVKDCPADTPSEDYWNEFPARVEARAAGAPARVIRLGNLHSWGWAVAAVLLLALGVAVYVAAGQARRASDAVARLAHAAAHTPAAPVVPVLPAAASREGTATDMRLFHELDLTFEGGVKWVATDGHKIDFGVSRELGPAHAVAEGPDRVAAVAVSVRRVGDAGRVSGERQQTVNEARIVGRTGCRADFTAQDGGLEFNYECLPIIRSDTVARLQLTVGVGRPEGDGYGAASAALDMRSGQSAEVARVVSNGVNYAIEVTLFVLPVKGHGDATGA